MNLNIARRTVFSAAHRLWNPRWDNARNLETYGNSRSHGHNFDLWVYFSGTVDPKSGMVAHLSDIGHRLKEWIEAEYDHRDLNTVPQLAHQAPTLEAIGTAMLGQARALFAAHPATPVGLTLIESPATQARVTLQDVARTWRIFPEAGHVQAFSFEWMGVPDPDSGVLLTQKQRGRYLDEILSTLPPSLEFDRYSDRFSQWFETHHARWGLTAAKVRFRNGMGVRVKNGRLETFFEWEFSAIHHLSNPALSQAECESLFGKCARTHGHRFRLKMVADGGVSSGPWRHLQDELQADLGEGDLNGWLENQNGQPTLATIENLVTALRRWAEQRLPLVALRLDETENNACEWRKLR
jgi:6-pyruvoyltetrahydropterin/6-carboxytetrahydropterin synthase